MPKLTPNISNEAATLTQKILNEISADRGRILIWGVNLVSLQILRELASYGLLNSIAGVVDDKSKESKIFGLDIVDTAQISNLDFDTLVVTEDANKESILMRFSEVDHRLPKVLLAGVRHLDFNDHTFQEILTSCPVGSKAGGYSNMLVHIFQSLVYLMEKQVQGAIAEFGVYQGGTTAFIAKTLRKFGSRAKVYGFDTFEGFPLRKSIFDQFQESKYEFRDIETVRRYLEPLGVELIKGDISTTYRQIEGIPLAFSFFDTDNYTPTHDALSMCYEQTVIGGIIAFDHYFCDERWLNTIGERIAVKQVLSGKRVFNLHGTGIFIKY